MAKTQFRYEFEFSKEIFFLGIGESKLNKEGQLVKVRKFERAGGEFSIMNILWVSIGTGQWIGLEQGKRTLNGAYREDFKRYAIAYTHMLGDNGTKGQEIKYNE